MIDTDRSQFDQALDSLAKVLRVTPLESEVKFWYFKALKGHSLLGIVEGVNKLTQTYKPRRKDDFPVPGVISDATEETVSSKPEHSRTPEEIQASYKRRGILIGDEAKQRLEDEILSKVEAETGERIQDRELYFNGPAGSRDPRKKP